MADDVAVRQSGNGGGGSQLAAKRPPGRLFADFFGFDPLRTLLSAAPQAANSFGAEISRANNGYMVEIPVPGFRPDQIEVTVQDDTVMVSGGSDRRNFTRSIVLPDDIDPNGIAASVEHGMLKLQLPQRPEAQPRRIAVQSSAS